MYIDEVMEQPQALRCLLDAYLDGTALATLKGDEVRGDILFTGIGSSCHASLVAVEVLNAEGIAAFSWEAGEFFYYNLGCARPDDLLIAVSQSGESLEVRKTVEALRGQVRLVGITNAPDSFLGRHCDLTLPLYAGPEEGTTSKTYVNTLALSLILAWHLSGKLGKAEREELRRIPDMMAHFLNSWQTRIDPLVEFLGEIPFLYLIARGPSLATAQQGALILQESPHIRAVAMSGATFRHGPIEMAVEGHRAIVFAPAGHTAPLSVNLACDMAELGSRVVLVSNVEVDLEHENLRVLALPQVDEYLFPLLDILPVELMLIRWAKAKGIEPGTFVVGGKITKKE
ncbi:MAG: SIS domain-containing protein [Anaerolineae bacterium]